ncbi:hypothetical protein EV424DRAFT_1396274 [Suillus variegatus]|nr:hypothetical protein EV424DRAFT_1396274 [Suillus variegatus]
MYQLLRAHHLASGRAWQGHSHHWQTSGIEEKGGGLPANCPRIVAAGQILSCGLRMTLASAGEHFWRLGQCTLIRVFGGRL